MQLVHYFYAKSFYSLKILPGLLLIIAFFNSAFFPFCSAQTPSTSSDKVSSTQTGKDLKFDIIPFREIYSSHEGLVMSFVFTARARTKLCLANDLLSQVQVSISGSGRGKIPLKPLIVKDNSQIVQEPMKVRWLESGESVNLRANLKRFQFNDGGQWIPGEYNVDAVFNLCEQTPTESVTDPGHEIPIKATHAGWFMIMI